MKSILFLLLLNCLFLSCKTKHQAEEDKNCIKAALAIDDSIGKVRNRECEHISLSRTISNYTANMKAIDLKGCPQNFAEGYGAHRKAWEAVLQITDRYPELRGEMHDLFRQLEKGKDSTAFKQRVTVIWSTWDEVEKASGGK